jgi:tetratricopeptide (TPR) repeat protein
VAQILPHHVHRADRFLYLPLVGLAIALAASLRPLGGLLKSRAAIAGAGLFGMVVLLLLDIRSTRQVQTWKDDVTVWENTVKVNPDNALAHDLLARNLAKRGQWDRVDEHAQRSLELDYIDNHEALRKRARALAALADQGPPDSPQRFSDCKQAVRLARRACELTQGQDPECQRTLAIAYCSLAGAQVAAGQFADAAENLSRAIEADDQFEIAFFNSAILLTTCRDPKVRNPAEAVRLAEQGCRLLEEPTPDKLRVLAEAYLAAGRTDMAITTAEKAAGIAQTAGDERMAENIRRWIKYRQE